MSHDAPIGLDLSVVKDPGYLGRAEVVQALMEAFVQNDILGADNPGMAIMSCQRMAGIWAGKVKGYTPIKGWEKDLAMILYRQFRIDPAQSPQDMLSTFFMDLTEAIYKLVNTLKGDELDRRIHLTTRNYSQALLGINGDYAWATKERHA